MSHLTCWGRFFAHIDGPVGGDIWGTQGIIWGNLGPMPVKQHLWLLEICSMEVLATRSPTDQISGHQKFIHIRANAQKQVLWPGYSWGLTVFDAFCLREVPSSSTSIYLLLIRRERKSVNNHVVHHDFSRTWGTSSMSLSPHCSVKKVVTRLSYIGRHRRAITHGSGELAFHGWNKTGRHWRALMGGISKLALNSWQRGRPPSACLPSQLKVQAHQKGAFKVIEILKASRHTSQTVGQGSPTSVASLR